MISELAAVAKGTLSNQHYVLAHITLISTPTIMLATTRKGAIKLRTKSRDFKFVMENTNIIDRVWRA
jgi:hypothetical protein